MMLNKYVKYTCKDTFEDNYPFIVLNRFAFNHTDSDFKVARQNNYKYCVIHYVTSGKGILIMNSRQYALSKGDMFFLAPNTSHVYFSSKDNPMELLWAEFHCGNSNLIVNAIINKFGHVIKLNSKSQIIESFENIYNCILQNENINQTNFSSILYNGLCSLYQTNHDIIKTNNILSPFISDTLDFINRNIKNRLNADVLAEHCGYSKEYFTRKFTNEVGIPPCQYITLIRLDYSIQLMITTNQRISDIAVELQFTDHTYFTKVFKKYFGFTPMQYKKYISAEL